MSAHWEQRPPPDLAPGPSWQGAPRTAAELTALRALLRTALRDGPLAVGTGDTDVTDDTIEALLLAFEELASNGLRHGRPPVHVTVTADGSGWLLEVSDAAADQPPTPAVDRDPARGGLGLYLIARLCAAHGWVPRGDRKYVWAYVAPVADASSDPAAGAR